MRTPRGAAAAPSGDPGDTSPGAGPTVAAARRGDPDAWRELYLRHGQRLLVWLRSVPLLDPAASAEDLAGETWLTAAAKVGEFSGSDDDFAPWLFTIARHHAANLRRKAARRRTDPVDVRDVEAHAFGSTHQDHRRIDEQQGVRALLAHLSPREAQVVACIDVVGLDVTSTAAALGMRPTAVRVARHRALGRLRGLVAGGQNPPQA